MSLVDVRPGFGNRDVTASEDDPTTNRSEASTESSSIGQPDDEDEEEEEEEVQSTLSSLASLEDTLPVKRGLSKHYGGKSKSFGNLCQVRNVKDLGKSENPFNKRRRTLMAYNLIFRNEEKTKSGALFYSHSNHISMPLLPLSEDHEYDSSDADDYYSPTSLFVGSSSHRLPQIQQQPYPAFNPTVNAAANTNATRVSDR